jgi:site-specific DNA-methyltransferase (adenine-specific)
MKDISNNSIDLFMCDLPYGCLKQPLGVKIDHKGLPFSKKVLDGCPWDIKIDLVEFWIQVKRLAKNDKTPVLMFCDMKFAVDLIISNPKWFRYDLVWSKNMGVSFLLANKMPMKSHEIILVFSKKGANYNRIDEFVEGMKGSFRGAHSRKGSKVYPAISSHSSEVKENIRCPLSVINIGRNHDKRHPTCKPIDLYEWLIKRYSNEGDTVLDPTAGSFNSGRSCVELKRNYIGMEMDIDFFNKNKIG